MKSLIAILLLASCVSARVENSTLIPAVVQSWPAVRVDVMYATDPPMAAVESMDAAIAAESKVLLRQVPWGILKSAALDGIQNQVGEFVIGATGALILIEQLHQFDLAILQLQKPTLVSSQVRDLPTAAERVAERRLALSYSNPYSQ